MRTKNYLEYIVKEMHSAVFATVDKEGRPVTCAIDIMEYDESGLYFLTAKGKNFYDRLKANENIAFTAMKGEDTLSCVAVSVRGRAREIGPDMLPAPFAKNPYMEKIYPTESSREALEVFQLYQGEGECFDLSVLPPCRETFSFGGWKPRESGYRIHGSRCGGCGICNEICPTSCIAHTIPRTIDQSHCIRCGNCLQVCPAGAVEKLGEQEAKR